MIIYQGAEAMIEKIDNKIVKKRIPKNYRIKELDEKLRKERNKKEIKILKEVRRLGINVPRVLEEGEYEFSMEYIEGKKLRDVIDINNFEFFAKEIAKIIAKLHFNNIVHNDLTLSNMLFSENKIYLIDFGLSEFEKSIEKKAEDLLTLYYSIKASFPSFWYRFMEIFFFEYKMLYRDGEKVIKRLEEILKRGRYVARI